MKEEALKLADEILLCTTDPLHNKASAMIRRLVAKVEISERDYSFMKDLALAYEKRIKDLESQLKDDEPMKICNLINATYQVVKNDEVLHQGSLESCESFIRVFEKA